MAFLFDKSYHTIGANGISPFQNMVAYLGGSAIQTVGDNPVTAYRQFVQQFSKDLQGNTVSPEIARKQANAVFVKSPMSASLSGLMPRLVGVLFKRIPKFGFLLGYSYIIGDGEPGMGAATAASILSAPFINPIRVIEKQQRAYYRQTGAEKPISAILSESASMNFTPLFRGTVPLMGHSLVSALLGLVGQPKLQKYVQKKIGEHSSVGSSASNLVASSIVSPFYVVLTNPISRIEVIMQTSAIKGEKIGLGKALKELGADMSEFGLRGVFRGQGIGIAKAIVSLSLFHEGRLFIGGKFKEHNQSKL